MLAIGTTVAATSGPEEAMRQMLGLTPSYGMAEVLAHLPVPRDVLDAAPEGTAQADLDAVEAYLIQPKNSDGSDAVIDDDPDKVFIALKSPQQPLAYHPQIGPIQTVVHTELVSKSDYLAMAGALVESEVESAYSELESELFAFAEQADDEADPEFLP